MALAHLVSLINSGLPTFSSSATTMVIHSTSYATYMTTRTAKLSEKSSINDGRKFYDKYLVSRTQQRGFPKEHQIRQLLSTYTRYSGFGCEFSVRKIML